MADVIPQTYADWRYCITVQCGLALSPDYIQARIQALSAAESEDSLRFRRLYGDSHWQNVLAWFRQAQAELPLL